MTGDNALSHGLIISKIEAAGLMPLVMKNRKFIRNDIDEKKILDDSVGYLSQIFSCRFVITDEDNEVDKRRIPLPGKPLIKLL